MVLLLLRIAFIRLGRARAQASNISYITTLETPKKLANNARNGKCVPQLGTYAVASVKAQNTISYAF